MQKAQKILFNTYWRSGGWIDAKNRHIIAEYFAYAKEKGLMLISTSHEQNFPILIKVKCDA